MRRRLMNWQEIELTPENFKNFRYETDKIEFEFMDGGRFRHRMFCNSNFSEPETWGVGFEVFLNLKKMFKWRITGYSSFYNPDHNKVFNQVLSPICIKIREMEDRKRINKTCPR